MDNYKASVASASRARNFPRDIESAVNDAGLYKDDWAGDVSDVGNFSNWRTAGDGGRFTSDAAFDATDFVINEDVEDSRETLLLRELDGSFLGESVFIGEDFHDGMFNIFQDDDDDESWDAEEWEAGDQDYY